MSQTSHPTKYTYYKNGIGTYSICCPTKLGLNYVSLVFSNELLAVEVVEELNAAIEFGKKVKRRIYTKEDQDRDRGDILNYDFENGQ